MDHLPRPRHTENVGVHFEIPVLFHHEFAYNDERFLNFGNKVELLGDNPGKVAPFLQAWLFFGLAKEVFAHISGLHMRWDDLVGKSERGEYLVLSTRKLEALICMWHAREADEPMSDRLNRLKEVVRCLKLADTAVSPWLDRVKPDMTAANLVNCYEPGYPLLAGVLLAIKALGATLCEAAKTVYGDFVRRVGTTSEPLFEQDFAATQGHLLAKVEFFSSYERDPILIELLTRSGWCPYQLGTCDRYYLTQGNLGLRYYFTFLDRCAIPGDHKNCTEQQCVGYHVDKETYRTTHFMGREDCGCQTLSLSQGFEQDPILLAVRAGATPVLRVIENRLSVAWVTPRADEQPPYVAISHVWAEGMGNPVQNALPLCQVLAMQKLAEHSCPGIPNLHFWVDTLCIPVNYPDERRQEIKKMTRIYAEAMKVVVVDRSLMNSSGKTNREEIYMRISRSPWASRLWTLQEGRLAKSVCFAFADVMHQTSHALQEIFEHDGFAVYMPTERNLATWRAWYEERQDATCLKLIRVAAALGIREAMECLQQLEQNHSKSLSPAETTTAPSSLASRIDRYCRLQTVRQDAKNSFRTIGSWNPQSGITSPLTVTELFADLLSTITRRGLTSPEDEAVCLATVLGVDVGQVLSHELAKERMWTLLTAVERLPLGILMIEDKEEQTYGRRWVPKTFLNGPIPVTTATCQMQPDGRLLYVGYGLIMDKPLAITNSGDGQEHFFVRNEEAEYFVGIYPQLHLNISSEAKRYSIIPSIAPFRRDNLPQPAVVLSLHEDETDASGGDPQCLQTRYEFLVWVFELPRPGQTATLSEPGKYHIWRPPHRHTWSIDTTSPQFTQFKVADVSQRWLIG